MSIIFKCGRMSATMEESTPKKAFSSLPWRSVEEVSLMHSLEEWGVPRVVMEGSRRNHMGKTHLLPVCLDHRGQSM